MAENKEAEETEEQLIKRMRREGRVQITGHPGSAFDEAEVDLEDPQRKTRGGPSLETIMITVKAVAKEKRAKAKDPIRDIKKIKYDGGDISGVKGQQSSDPLGELVLNDITKGETMTSGTGTPDTNGSSVHTPDQLVVSTPGS